MSFSSVRNSCGRSADKDKKRRPPQGGRRANDAIVGVVNVIYTMFHSMSRMNSQILVNILCKDLLNVQCQA